MKVRNKDDNDIPGKRSLRAGKVELSTDKACSIFFQMLLLNEIVTKNGTTKELCMMKRALGKRDGRQVEVE